MKLFFNRLSRAWGILTGKYYLFPPGPKVVYVEDGKRENQFVQLQYFEGDLLALDAQGKIWKLRRQYDSAFIVELLMESPRSY